MTGSMTNLGQLWRAWPSRRCCPAAGPRARFCSPSCRTTNFRHGNPVGVIGCNLPTQACTRPQSASVSTMASSSSRSTSSSTTAKPPEMCVIVDDNNNVVGAATRYETVSKRLLGRGSYVLVFNSQEQLFVSKRSMSKDCYPGCLDVTISGVVNQGEEYANTAVRELQEELGIPTAYSTGSLQQLFIFPYKDNVCHVWGCAFKLVWDGPVSFQDAEVEWGRFMNVADLQRQLEKDPERFTPVGRHILGLYLQQQQQQLQQQ